MTDETGWTSGDDRTPWGGAPTDAHVDDDDLVALALGELSVQESTATLRHLEACSQCRHEYDEISAAVERTAAAAPRVEPPAGFEDRALAAIRAEAHPDVVPLARKHRPQRRRSRVLLAAAAAVAGLVVGTGGTIAGVQLAGGGQDHGAVYEAGAVPLRTPAGAQVGTVTAGTTAAGDHRVAVVSIEGGAPGAHYRCELVRADGTRTTVGEWTIGSSAEGTWVVPLSAGAQRMVLVSDSGADWAVSDLSG
ncbi:MAG TPA: hypothetical protein VFJ19_10820 [Nocardioidaceae bacterium]|nr:hypothetical protein [Nocardioidaceae bacterium]